MPSTTMLLVAVADVPSSASVRAAVRSWSNSARSKAIAVELKFPCVKDSCTEAFVRMIVASNHHFEALAAEAPVVMMTSSPRSSRTVLLFVLAAVVPQPLIRRPDPLVPSLFAGRL
jgi:hypothetical protein